MDQIGFHIESNLEFLKIFETAKFLPTHYRVFALFSEIGAFSSDSLKHSVTTVKPGKKKKHWLG